MNVWAEFNEMMHDKLKLLCSSCMSTLWLSSGICEDYSFLL